LRSITYCRSGILPRLSRLQGAPTKSFVCNLVSAHGRPLSSPGSVIYFFFSSFLIFLSAFFSFGVFAGSFLVAFLVSCPLLMIVLLVIEIKKRVCHGAYCTTVCCLVRYFYDGKETVIVFIDPSCPLFWYIFKMDFRSIPEACSSESEGPTYRWVTQHTCAADLEFYSCLFPASPINAGLCRLF